MQQTSEFRTAVVPLHPRPAAIFLSGTRSPAPHHAAMMTSGSRRAISSAETCAPGLPRNSPPAAATSSATQGCDAMIGLPHSSQNTRFLARPDVWRAISSIATRISEITCAPRSPAPTQPEISAMSRKCRPGCAEPGQERESPLSGSLRPPLLDTEPRR